MEFKDLLHQQTDDPKVRRKNHGSSKHFHYQ